MNLFDSRTLLTILAAGQGIALVYASVVLDGHGVDSPLFWLALAKGLPLGFGSAFAASFAGHKLSHSFGGRGKMSGAARNTGIISLGLQELCTIVAVSICGVGIPQDALRWIASVAFATMVSASVIAVAAVSAAMFSDSAAQSDKPAQDAKPSAAQAPQSKKQAQAKNKEPLTCPHCEVVGVHPVIESEAQRSGHIAWCANNPKSRRKAKP